MTPAVTPPPAAPLMTAEEFVKLHGHESGVELVKGRIVRLPMPGGKHGEVCVKASYLLMQYVLAQKCGRVLGNHTFVRTTRGPDSYRGADVLFISYERLPKDQPTPDGPMEVAPELAIEVRSPFDRLNQLTAKAAEYLEAGVSVVLILDPNTESAAVFTSDELPRRYHNGDELTLPSVLPGFRVPVKALFE